jgi:hypothetical protein
MARRDSALRAHYGCDRCGWELIVADDGTMFEGVDASERYLGWLNDPSSPST